MKVAGKGLVLDGVGEAASKKSKKAVAAGKRKAREEEEEENESVKKRGANLESPALTNGEGEKKESPAPAKRGRKVVKDKVLANGKKSANARAAEQMGRKMRNGGAGNIESECEEDMFAASPSPAKKVLSPVKKVAKFKEAGSQVNSSLG